MESEAWLEEVVTGVCFGRVSCPWSNLVLLFTSGLLSKHPISVLHSHQDVSSSRVLKAVDSGGCECILPGVCPSDKKSDWQRHGSLVLHSHALF